MGRSKGEAMLYRITPGCQDEKGNYWFGPKNRGPAIFRASGPKAPKKKGKPTHWILFLGVEEGFVLEGAGFCYFDSVIGALDRLNAFMEEVTHA